MDFREDVLGIVFTVLYEKTFSVNVLKFTASELEHVAREFDAITQKKKKKKHLCKFKEPEENNGELEEV